MLTNSLQESNFEINLILRELYTNMNINGVTIAVATGSNNI